MSLSAGHLSPHRLRRIGLASSTPNQYRSLLLTVAVASQRSFMSTNYHIRIHWSKEDGEYIATCPSFPSLSFGAITAAKAAAGLRTCIADILEDMQTTNETPPTP